MKFAGVFVRSVSMLAVKYWKTAKNWTGAEEKVAMAFVVVGTVVAVGADEVGSQWEWFVKDDQKHFAAVVGQALTVGVEVEMEEAVGIGS